MHSNVRSSHPELYRTKKKQKKVFLKISQNSQESTRAGISFLIKLQTPGNFIKIKALALVFSYESCEIITIFFIEHISWLLFGYVFIWIIFCYSRVPSFFVFFLLFRFFSTQDIFIPTQVFSCEYSVTFRNTYFEEHLRTGASEREALIFY